MKKKYLFAPFLLFVMSFQLINAQSCPTSIGNSSTTTRPHFKISSGTCNDYPNSISIDGSTFSKGACNGTNLYYDLTSGPALSSDDTFTANFGNGDCVYVNGTLQTLSIETEENPVSKTKVFPNPIAESDVLNLLFNKNVSGQLNLFDVTGKLVFRDAISNTNMKKINISGLNNGIYMLQIVADNVSSTRKIVVMK